MKAIPCRGAPPGPDPLQRRRRLRHVGPRHTRASTLRRRSPRTGRFRKAASSSHHLPVSEKSWISRERPPQPVATRMARASLPPAEPAGSSASSTRRSSTSNRAAPRPGMGLRAKTPNTSSLPRSARAGREPFGCEAWDGDPSSHSRNRVVNDAFDPGSAFDRRPDPVTRGTSDAAGGRRSGYHGCPCLDGSDETTL